MGILDGGGNVTVALATFWIERKRGAFRGRLQHVGKTLRSAFVIGWDLQCQGARTTQQECLDL
ncbi:hypothetical protein BVK86_19535 [Pseudomonas reinekei]|uniref:Uncharacterized protein n=1 Tax=Pseudomonas reinekei TaxID=395598 RepID=A0A1Q9WQS5_PSERE|nr:hypothetical protein BVK86_19535 [Pseudomonas reinekei]